MEIKVNDGTFLNAKVPVEIDFLQWLKLKLFGKVKVFEGMKKGWSGPLPFFVFKCDNCGELGLDYHHGHSGRLDCPVCNVKPRIKLDVEAKEAIELAV